MIYQRAAQREFAQTALAVFTALLFIVLTSLLIRMLRLAAGGWIAPKAVLALLGFGVLGYLQIILSLTLFISVLMTLSRMYRDSEMVVWFSSGLSLRDWAKPVLRFTVPIVVVIFAVAFFLAPWALSRSDEYRQRMSQRNDMSQMAPGTFRESASGNRVFFVESINDAQAAKGEVKNVFINSVQEGRLGIMAAATGHVEQMPNGDRFIALEHGHRYEGLPDDTEFRTMDFERYLVRIETPESSAVAESSRGYSTHRLIKDPTPANRGELLWRIGITVSALMLALMAIPLAFVNPRAGRTNNLVFAVLAFMIYNNLLTLSMAWVARGRLPFGVGLVAVHIFMFVILLLLFWRRLSLFTWGRLWR